MTVKEKSNLNQLLSSTQASIFRNVDYIPISQWGFDEMSMDLLKKQKHAAVNKKLSKKQQKKLGNEQKQQIAQSIGVVPQTISEVYKALSHSKVASKRPKRPNVRITKKSNSDETKENGPELDPEIAEILKKKGVGKRPFIRNAIDASKKSDDADNEENGIPFKKARRQHQPLNEAEKQKRKEASKKNRKMKASKAKEARNAEIKSETASVKSDGDATKPVGAKSDLSFSRLEFVLKDDKAPTKKERSEKLSGRDYTSLQKKIQKRTEYVEKIREKNPDKAQSLEEKIKWDTAIKRAEGKKVKDDPKLLEKAVNRKNKMKDKRKKEWTKRTDKVVDDKQKKQQKRETNIAKRRDDKVKKKLERSRKKGRAA